MVRNVPNQQLAPRSQALVRTCMWCLGLASLALHVHAGCCIAHALPYALLQPMQQEPAQTADTEWFTVS